MKYRDHTFYFGYTEVLFTLHFTVMSLDIIVHTFMQCTDNEEHSVRGTLRD